MADEAIARGQMKALTGIPMTVKESFDLRGHPSDVGLRGVHATTVRARTRWRCSG